MEKAVTPEFGLDPWNWVAGGTRYIEGSAFLSTTQLALFVPQTFPGRAALDGFVLTKQLRGKLVTK